MQGDGHKGWKRIQDSDFCCSSGKRQSITSCSPYKPALTGTLLAFLVPRTALQSQLFTEAKAESCFSFTGNSLQDFLAHGSERRAEQSHSNNKGPVKMLCSDRGSKGNSHSAHPLRGNLAVTHRLGLLCRKRAREAAVTSSCHIQMRKARRTANRKGFSFALPRFLGVLVTNH